MAEENKPEISVVRHEVRVVGVELKYSDTIFLILQLTISAIPAIILLGFLFVGLYAIGIQMLVNIGSPANSFAPW